MYCGEGVVDPVIVTTTSHECSKLDPDTVYEVIVVASNEAGEGEFTNITTSTACEGIIYCLFKCVPSLAMCVSACIHQNIGSL